MYGTNMREREEFSRCFPPGQPVQTPPPSPRALGLDVLHSLCKQIYPDQSNPLTVTAVVKYWLGGPDPLDYISMYANPGYPELGVPPHWHYVRKTQYLYATALFGYFIGICVPNDE